MLAFLLNAFSISKMNKSDTIIFKLKINIYEGNLKFVAVYAIGCEITLYMLSIG